MRKNELLQDAIGLIGDDLIMDAKASGSCTKKTGVVRWLPKVAVAAACVALLAGGWLLLAKSQSPVSLPPVKNLWEREDFQAYSLVYSNLPASHDLSFDEGPKIVFLSQTETVPPSTFLPDNTVTASPILLSSASTVKVESLIGGRYAAYVSDTGAPIFFDTQEGVSVDLKQRILGDRAADLNAFLELVEKAANQRFPGMLEAEINREFLLEAIWSFVNHTACPKPEDWELDTSFMGHLDEYQYTSDKDRPGYFISMCWGAYTDALRLQESQEGYEPLQPYRVRFLSVDAHSGKCIVQILDMVGSVLSVQLYDMVTDTLICQLANGDWHGTCVRYSPDGKMLTIASGGSIISTSGPAAKVDYTQRYEYGDTRLGIWNYYGEGVSVVNADTGWHGTVGGRAASEGFLSESGKVCYFKKIPEECLGKSFYVSNKVWLDRLALFNRDTDQWIFCTPSAQDPYGKKTTLQGNFVRFMADETVAVMERGGQYYAYLLGTDKETETELQPNRSYFSGLDITEQMRKGQYPVVPHERLRVFCKDGILYKQDLFSGEPAQVVAPADQYILSSDGAFAFVYINGSDYAMCYNVATLESCAIALDPQLCSQLNNTEGAVFRMTYNDEENSLTLSFYLEEEVSSARRSTVDFFGLLAELESESYYESEPTNPKRYTEYQVSEEIMEQFRWSAYQQEHSDGIITWDWYYPKSLPIYLDRFHLFEALGITPPEEYLDVNGTEFVLYEDEDEKLTLIFYKFWGLYDYPQADRGFYIQYDLGTRSYLYGFYELEE